jgi:glycosyltransferase involved in cell wall biosynthesis
MSANKPLVSITSAFYNEEPFLLEMVKSVFCQTFPDWELILLDDGSTDNSLQIAKSIDDPRVRVFANGQNLGRSVSLNRLTGLARGKYIARMDADDISSSTRIEKQVELLESRGDVDVVGTGLFYLDENDKPVGCHRYPTTHPEICRYPSRFLGIVHGTVVATKTWFERHIYNEALRIAVDSDMLFKACRDSIFTNIPEPLYYYRLDQSFHLGKQFMARKASARFLFEYYKNAGRLDLAVYNWAVQYGKQGCTLMAFAVGLREKLMSRRYEPLAASQYDYCTQEIEKIKDTKLPLRT